MPQSQKPVHKADFDIMSPVDYTVANNHDAVYNLLVNKYRMVPPQTPMETCQAVNAAIAQFGQPFIYDFAMMHPDLEPLLKETGHYGSCCSEKSNLLSDNISYNLELLQNELKELTDKLSNGIPDPTERQIAVDRIAWLKVTIAAQSKPNNPKPETSNSQSNLLMLGVIGLVLVGLVVASKNSKA